MMEKLTRDEWETYIGLHGRVVALVEKQRGTDDEFVVPLLAAGHPAIDIWNGDASIIGTVDMAGVIHDPARERAGLRAKIEAMIVEAGEAGEGLAVVESEPEPLPEPVVRVRFVGLDADGDKIYALDGGPFDCARAWWAGHEMLDGVMTLEEASELARLTAPANALDSPSLREYLAACVGTWTMVEEA